MRDTLVTPSLQTLLAGIIDYAGLFPPAALPLDEALLSYARYRQEADAWMLGRFIIPIKRLSELDPYAELFEQNPPFRFSVLGTGGPDPKSFLNAFSSDLKAIEAFHQRFPGMVRAEVMEVRLPVSLLGATSDTVQSFLHAVGQIVATHLPALRLFYEVPINNDLPQHAPAILDAMAAYNADQSPPVGFKMRTGGVTPEAFPAPALVAFAIAACRDAGVPFKATAGLHHPVRHYNESVLTQMHGFFNVFGAGVLAAVHNLDVATLQALLLDEEATRFQVTPNTFAWNEHVATSDAIRKARTHFAISFGSCSFDEPREDLQALGYL